MRYFTVHEANAFVPALQEVFGDIEKLRRKVVRLLSELEDLEDRPGSAAFEGEAATGPVLAKRQQIFEGLEEIRRLVGELESHGLIVKELEGLVDFRSIRGQRPVFLCWRRGEARIEHWHELWSDSGSLRPVDKLFPKPLLN